MEFTEKGQLFLRATQENSIVERICDKKQKSIEPLSLHSEGNNRELILHSRDMVSVQ